MASYVYHMKEWHTVWKKEDMPEFPKEYRLVARLETNDLEEVFYLTNHIDHSWYENDGILWCEKDARSTSVGDVVVVDYGNDRDCGLKKVYMCASSGWEELDVDSPVTDTDRDITDPVSDYGFLRYWSDINGRIS